MVTIHNCTSVILNDREEQNEEITKKESELFSMTQVAKTQFPSHIDRLTPSNCYLLFFKIKQDSPRSFSPESELVPLNEYRRNRLMRLSEMLRGERNRFDDAMEEERTTA